MKILITGNCGYIGPTLIKTLRTQHPNCEIIGFDACYFSHCLTGAPYFPESHLSAQHVGDVRQFPAGLLEGVDTVIHLAAISNDPMGKTFEKVTDDINCKASINIATMAKKAGVKNFVFASSCSMYGAADGPAKKESDSLNPLTAYARSKVGTEQGIEKLASENFVVTSHRFATACGASDRLRLDLVLNDFVAGALINGKVDILSDGSPWRPLITVDDMTLAMSWSANRQAENGGNFLAVNTGSNTWNYQVKDLAKCVAETIPNVAVNINLNAEPDKRSYKVNFDLFSKLAPDYIPKMTLTQTINGLAERLRLVQFPHTDYRNSNYVRLHVLNNLRESSVIDEDLFWQK